MPVLLRPDDTVQVGWDPRRAIVVRPPAGLSAAALADLLRLLQGGVTPADLLAVARNRGAHDDGAVTALLAALTDTGLLSATPARVRTARVRVHGRGPLSDLLLGALRCSGTRVQHSRLSHAAVTTRTADLVVLADDLVADPHVVRALHTAAVAYLPVRVRDGTGLVGPLVLPGRSSCVRCADLHRSDRDAAWPAVAAQLRRTVGTSGRAAVLGTAALALDQVDRVVAAIHAGPADLAGDLVADPPPTVDTTLEFDVRTGSTVRRHWTRHPRCGC